MNAPERPRRPEDPAVIWPDGCMDSAPTWLALFDRVRRGQWHRYTRKAFRQEMERRASVLSGVELDLSTCDLRTFFERLESVDVCRIVGGVTADA